MVGYTNHGGTVYTYFTLILRFILNLRELYQRGRDIDTAFGLTSSFDRAIAVSVLRFVDNEPDGSEEIRLEQQAIYNNSRT